VILIAGVLLTLGVPRMSAVVSDNRRVAEINRVVGAINLARSEAIRRRAMVTLCASTDGRSCDSSGSWELGWIVFVNNDADDPPVVDPGETVLRVGRAIEGTVTLRGTGSYTSAISYRSRGFAQVPGSSSAGGMLVYCDDRGAAKARAVIITSTGRPRLSTDSDGDGVDEDDAGNDLVCPS